MYYLEVAPTITFRAGADVLTYHHDVKLTAGTIVTIPVGRKTVPGVIVRTVNKPDFATKPISQVLYDTPLPPHLISAAKWLSEYYACPLSDSLRAILPTGVNVTRRITEFELLEPASVISTVQIERNFANCNDSRNEAKTSPRDDGSDSCRVRTIGAVEILLNPHQHKAVKQILSNPSTTRLLHGITGSGKTNIYLHLAHEIIGNNKSFMLLLPEISLTTQLVQIFQKHFANQVITLHSRLTDRQRHLLWQRILTTTTPLVIIGTRSALFAPLHNLGAIVIDEAHEPAYLQDQNPKYSALRLASFIAAQTKSYVLQGTATPAIADYSLASRNQAIIELSQPAIKNTHTTQIHTIDLRDHSQFTKHRFFSNQLLESIQQSISTKTQTLIFHNRRGSAPTTVCDECGWIASCPTCSLPLVLHTDQYQLICHACGHKTKVPSSCPTCRNASILHRGIGTKLIETELIRLFPQARIIRFDADNKSTPDQLYNEICSGNFDIIIGTQMIAKGFDLPLLSTLAIIQADSLFSLPDYTSTERGYQLLTQAIGRGTRGHRDTQVFIQTYQPNHPVVQFATMPSPLEAFKSFYDATSSIRRNSHLPPFTYLLKLTLTYKTEASVVKNTTALRQQLLRHPNISVSSPFPAFHELSTKGYTWQLNITAKSRSHLLNLIKSLPPNPALHYYLDPPNLL